MDRRLSVALVALFAVAVPVVASAQERGPDAGTWGAETSGGSVSVLRFRSPSSAWLLGIDGLYLRRDDEEFPAFDDELFSVTLFAGLRRYRNVDNRVRPFTTLSAIVGYDDTGDIGWRFGGGADFGGAYFFSPHVSLGTALGLNAFYARGTRTDPLGQESTVTTLVMRTGLRMLAAVYF